MRTGNSGTVPKLEVVGVLCFQVEGMEIVIESLVGSTGLEMKVDPGVPYVYAGFGGKKLWHSPTDHFWECI